VDRHICPKRYHKQASSVTRLTGTPCVTLLKTNSMEQCPSSEADSRSTYQQISCLCGTRKFINEFNCTLSSARRNQSRVSHENKKILLPSNHLRLVLPNVLFPGGIPIKYRSHFSSKSCCPSPLHTIILKWILNKQDLRL
jgi:hypothetical protein